MARILLADADPAVTGPMSAQLMLMGHEVEVVENGKVAVERVRTNEYDLIIADIRLPVMTGLELLNAVMPRIESVTPCLVITGYHDVNHATAAMQAGAMNLLLRPWNLQDLEVAVKQALARRAEMKVRRDYQADLERRIKGAEAELKASTDLIAAELSALLRGMDPTTADHAARVRALSTKLAMELGLEGVDLWLVELVAELHDLGKFRISRVVREKPAPLDPQELAEMRKHPEYGSEILERRKFPSDAVRGVLHHHEHWDGTGYPAALRGDDIPISSRIVLVASAYDAITTARPYRPAQDHLQALREIKRCSGKEFDPSVVAALESVSQIWVAHDGILSAGLRPH